MQRLVINIPNSKSNLVKQILKGLGVTFQQESKSSSPSTYKKKLTKVSTWSDEDIHILEESKNTFGDIKPPQW